MGRYAVDMAELQHVDTLLRDCAEHGRAELASLSRSAQDLFAGGWQSPAATQFQLGWHEWVDGAHEALAALQQMSAAVGAAGQGYGQTESSVRSGIAAAS